jgi:hypothetical protein
MKFAEDMKKIAYDLEISKGYKIETYHGLTTSKLLQLRCFQGG